MKPRNLRFPVIAASVLAISLSQAQNYDWVGATGASWGTSSNWSPSAVPPSSGAILINRDVTAALSISYAVAPETATTRQISSVTFNDTTSPIFNVTLQPGVAGSQLEFPTTTPVISSTISNTSSGGQRLTIQNPLFSSAATTLTKAGTGNVRLEFLLASGVTAFNTNVTSLTSSTAGGDLWLSGPSGSTLNLPNTNFGTNNTRLSLTGSAAVDVNSGVTVNTGTNEIYIGGGCTTSFKAGSTLSGNGFTLSSNNSTYYYVQGNSTLNWAGTGSVGRIRWAEQMSNSLTSTVNVTAGTLTLTGSAGSSYAGSVTGDGSQHNVNLNISGGIMAFSSATQADFNFGQSTRNNATVPTTLTTVTGAVTLSGTGTLDMGPASRLVLGTRNSTNTIVNTNATLNLNGGTLITARDINRGTIGTGAGTTQARVILNGGTLRTTASISNLFTGFSGPSDGIFVSSAGAVIDTQALSSGITPDLQEDPLSTGGGLTKSGAGVLTISGAFGTTGPTVINAGSLRFNRADGYTLGQATSGAGTAIVQQGTVNVTSPSFSPHALVIGSGSNSLVVAVNWTGTGTVSQSVVNDQAASVTGVLNVSEGSLTLGGAASGTAYPDLYLRAMTVGGKGPGELNVSGGSLIVNSNKRLIIGGLPRFGGTGTAQEGTFTISSGTADLAGTGDFWIGYSQNNADASFTGTGSVVLDGGTLQTSRTLTEFNYLAANDANSSVVLNGGTLKAGASDNANWIANGAIDSVTTTSSLTNVDTNGRSMGISAAISGTGGITKSGTGTLTLGGLNSYTGETSIAAGTLSVTQNGALANEAAVRLASDEAVLDLAFSGSDTVDRLYIGGTEQASGIWGSLSSNATHKTAKITGSGTLTVTNGISSGSFSTWATENNVTGGASGDSDGDGISNLLEYALALNPAASDGSAGTINAGTVSFEKRAVAVANGDVTYTMQISNNLVDWTSVTPTTNTGTNITYILPTEATKTFSRLMVSLPN